MVKQEGARNLWPLKTRPHLDFRLGQQVWIEYPHSYAPSGRGRVEWRCVLILTFLPFLLCTRFYHVGNLLQLVLLGWTA